MEVWICGRYDEPSTARLTRQPELDALCFPLFAHTFLDLMHFGFIQAGEQDILIARLSSTGNH